MLRKLTIKNLVLIDFAHIEFSSGLNIFTGESGSGKSVLFSALSLIAGRKASSELIRENEEIAWVEALFEINENYEILALLKKYDLSFPEKELLCIRREITRNSKTRSFLCDQLVPLSLLKEISQLILQIADQNSHDILASQTYQRTLLDLYAGLTGAVKEFALGFQKENELEIKLQEDLILREKLLLEKAQSELALKELLDANIKEGEDQKLSEQHNLLTHSQEALEKIEAVYAALQDPLPSRLFRSEQLLLALCKIHARFQEGYELVKTARIELEEASRFALQMRGTFDSDPLKITIIEERLQVLENLKKKYGPDLEMKRNSLQKRLAEFALSEDSIEELQKNLKEQKERNIHLCHLISQKRISAAHDLQSKIGKEMHSLNLAQGNFQIEVKPCVRTSFGSDHIVFNFTANQGQTLKPLGVSASGGELSRILLAFQTALAEKSGAQTLIFDEIDSNVGGKTAVMIGEKLRYLGKFCQILSVTHFVQVAKLANSHFLVQKKTHAEKSFTSIEKIADELKEKEFARMIGN